MKPWGNNYSPTAIDNAALVNEAVGAAQWVTASPHEWVWTHDQQVAMARYIMRASRELDLWRWLTENRCIVQENAVVGAPLWAVLDVDGNVIGQGNTPIDAIAAAVDSTAS